MKKKGNNLFRLHALFSYPGSIRKKKFDPQSLIHFNMKTTYIIAILLSSMLLTSCNQKQKAKTDNTQLSPATETKANEPVTIQPQAEPDSLKGSIKALATGRIGNTFITINYHSPAVRGRMVWGGLVPFDQVWVTGAHMATTIEFEGSVKIGDQELAGGKYGFFTIPSQNEWIVIINKNWEQHLADEYDQKDDLIRLNIKPEILSENQERLMYSVDNTGISVRWEKIRLVIPVYAN
jgi:hypothetical protein